MSTMPHMNPVSEAGLELGAQTYQSSFAVTSPVDSQFSSNGDSLTSDSIVASPLEFKAETDDFFSTGWEEVNKDTNDQHEPEDAPKRKRGRPRKHPIVPIKPKNGRSRTGCITCRKRKKKCDETRPECLNCKHMNKVCEGFQPPEKWHSSRQKLDIQAPPLPKLIHGVEEEADRILLDHFTLNLSQSLCLCDGKSSPFETIIVPLALNDLGLMHAVLCLSGFQLANNNAKSTTLESSRTDVVERRHFHFERALQLLREKLKSNGQSEGAPYMADDATVATMAMLCMRAAIAGECNGEHEVHLQAALRSFVDRSSSNSGEFRDFIIEFLAYHDISCSITSSAHQCSFIDDPFRLPSFVPSAAGSYLGVLDGLWCNISKINNLRERIRKRRVRNSEPVVDSQSLHTAQVIDAELQDWISNPQEDTPRSFMRQLYRQCTWIYLYRTIYHYKPNTNLIQGVDNGLSLLRRVRNEESIHPVLLMPVFLLGCAAFEPRHRAQINCTLSLLESKRGSGNIKHVRTVVQEVWRLMDLEDRDSWDWETLMENMKLNFLIS